VLRVGEELLGACRLDHAAGVHHHHEVRHLGHHAQVVRDEHDGHASVALEVAQQREDLRLDGDVQRRGGLVGDEQLGLARQRHGDHDALTHAPAERVWVVAHALLGRRDAHLPQELDGARLGVLLRHLPVQAQRLADLRAHAVDRVERAHGLLEDHGDVVAAQAAHLPLRELHEVAPLEQDLTRFELAGGLRHQAHDRQRRDALAAAALAHHAHGGAPRDDQRHVVHGAQRAFVGVEGGRQTADLEQGTGHGPAPYHRTRAREPGSYYLAAPS
jgi:hypothetical protein